MAAPPKALVSSENNRRETPKWLFHALHEEFDFHFDAAADASNARLPMYIGPQHDTLKVRWSDLLGRRTRAFMNPPWGYGDTPDGNRVHVQDFIAKAHDESKNGVTCVSLLPANVNTKWFHLYGMQAAEIRFFDGRIHYELNGKLPLAPKKRPDDPDRLSSASVESLILVFRPRVGLSGGPRIVSMSSDPRSYGEEAIRLWKKSNPLIQS